MNKKLKLMINKLKDLLFPRGLVCIRCGKELGDDGRALELCPDCLNSIPFCLDEGDGEVIADTHFDEVYYNLRYKDYARTIVLDYKDGGKNWLHYNMVNMMRIPDADCDIVTYVPCHKKAIRKRGFDHAKELGRNLAEKLGKPFVQTLTRTKQKNDSSKLSKQERQNDIKNSFAVSKRLNTETLKGKTVLLVDDLLTTGATASECSRVLKELGVSKVLVCVFCRT